MSYEAFNLPDCPEIMYGPNYGGDYAPARCMCDMLEDWEICRVCRENALDDQVFEG